MWKLTSLSLLFLSCLTTEVKQVEKPKPKFDTSTIIDKVDLILSRYISEDESSQFNLSEEFDETKERKVVKWKLEQVYNINSISKKVSIEINSFKGVKIKTFIVRITIFTNDKYSDSRNIETFTVNSASKEKIIEYLGKVL